MKIETISKEGGSYSSTESAVSKPVQPDKAPVTSAPEKVASAKAAKAETVAAAVQEDENSLAQGGMKEHQPSEATIDDAVRSANRRLDHTHCEYSYHKETNRVSIKVINDSTKEVIREIPPEKSLDMLQKLWEMAGILVDKKR